MDSFDFRSPFKSKNTGLTSIVSNILVKMCFSFFKMASVLHQGLKRTTDAYGCNWLERLRQIKRLRSKATSETTVPCSPPSSLGKTPPGQVSPTALTHPHLVDFTEYVMSERK